MESRHRKGGALRGRKIEAVVISNHPCCGPGIRENRLGGEEEGLYRTRGPPQGLNTIRGRSTRRPSEPKKSDMAKIGGNERIPSEGRGNAPSERVCALRKRSWSGLLGENAARPHFCVFETKRMTGQGKGTPMKMLTNLGDS